VDLPPKAGLWIADSRLPIADSRFTTANSTVGPDNLYLCLKNYKRMSLLNQNKGKGKKGKKEKPQGQGSKFIQKPAGKAQGGSAQKPHKAGGTRGS